MSTLSEQELNDCVHAGGGNGQRDSRHERLCSLIVAVLAIGAGGTVLLATRRGIGIVNDSVHYISAARSLARGRGYRDFTGEPLTTFAPVFPMLLAGGIKLGVGVATAAKFVNAAAYTAIVLLSWLLVRRHVRSQIIALGTVALIAFSLGLSRIADKAMSEPVFLVVAFAGLLVFEEGLRARGRRGYWLLAGAGALYGVAFVTRYAGLAFAVAGVLTLLIYRRGAIPTPRGVTARCGVFLLAWSVLPTLWLLRNATSGAQDILGPRIAIGGSPFATLSTFASAVGAVFLSNGAPRAVTYLVAGIVLIVVVTATCLVAVQQRDRAPDAVLYPFLPVLVLLVAYTGFAWYSHWQSGSSLDARIMSPIFILVVISAAFVLDWIREKTWDYLPGWVRVAALAVFGGVVLANCLGTLVIARNTGRTTYEYADPALRGSRLAQAVRALPDNTLVATNNPYILYYVTDHEPTQYTPGRVLPGTSLRPPTVAQFERRACRRGHVRGLVRTDESKQRPRTPRHHLSPRSLRRHREVH